jgi:hypothetical protein
MSRDVQDAPFVRRRGRPGAAWAALVGTGRHPPELAGFDDADTAASVPARRQEPHATSSARVSSHGVRRRGNGGARKERDGGSDEKGEAHDG